MGFLLSFLLSFFILFAVCFQVVDILLRSILLSMFLLMFTTTLLFTTTKWYANNRVIWCKRTKLKQSGRKRTRSRVVTLLLSYGLQLVQGGARVWTVQRHEIYRFDILQYTMKYSFEKKANYMLCLNESVSSSTITTRPW